MTAPGRVGESPNRVGGIGRVTGAQQYLADLRVDALHAKLVTLDVARARIRGVDASAALALPGVRLVMTAADLPQPVPRFGPQREDRPVLATGETTYHGEPVALVVADTKDLAERAAALVRVDHEPLPAVFTLEGALAPDAPLVQDPATRPGDPLAHTNVLKEHRVGWGDVDGEAGHAHVTVEGTWTFPMVTQFAIEPHAFMAAPDGDGIAVWSTIQHPNWLQRVIAGMLRMPLSKVRVYAPDPGGGFGGKQHAKYEPAVAFAALRLGRPVRLVLTLEETFQAVRRAACETRVRAGLAQDGRILFLDIAADYLIGAYTDIADRVVGKGSYPAAGPYNVAAVRILARSVLSHTVPSTAFRGFGNPQVNWAVESALDEGARALGMDPLALRLRNLARRGDRFIPFDTPCDGDWADVVRVAAERAGWGTPLPDGHGRGIAFGIKSGPTTGLSYSIVRMLADGSVVVYAGTSDMGQGARTVLAQVAAHELGVPLDWVTVVMGDTAIVPYDQQTSASRSTVLMGNAVLDACRKVQAQLAAMAARLHGVDEAGVSVDAGVVRLPDGRELTPLEVLKPGLGRLGGELTGVGESRKDAEPDHPLGGAPAFFEFNCTVIEAHVDEETGDITIDRHVTASDVGKALNPLQVRMQDEGAAIMGLGHTLMEQYLFDDTGRIRNLGAIDYRIPTSMDLPISLESEAVEHEDGPGPYGAKGMSEGALLCVAPAVAAAVHQATGATIRALPLSPERVWHALQARRADAPVTLVYASDHRHDLDPAAITLLLGGKAANLATMAGELGLPVPPAFTITTEACNAYLASGWPVGLDEELRGHMARLEARVGRRFGDPADPLLVSVRSGAPRSMPGMMDTILNLGLTDVTEAGLAAASGDPAFARDCHERLRATYRAVVGVESLPDDPWLQLRGAIEAVFRSWNSERARAYRAVEGISDTLGTGVTVQAMVFGNLGAESGTGVLFTRNPATGEHQLYGDVLFDAQGEDVVSGTHATAPVASLGERLPVVAAELRRYADVLERQYRDCCDIEFTIERGRLWLLQVRVGKRTPQAALRMAVDMAEDPAFPLTREEAVARVASILADPPTTVVDRGATGPALTRGLGVSPGLVSGQIRLSAGDAIAAADRGADVILVRPETSPDDIAGMDRARGILTATGGFASHAAVVARGWGKPAVVGAGEIVIGAGRVRIGTRELAEGDVISIDGSTGDVYEGVRAGVAVVVPEARTLLGWARDAGIPVGDAEAGATTAVTDAVEGTRDEGDALRTLAVKGYATPDAIAAAIRSPLDIAQGLLDGLIAGGLAEPGAGAFRLTDAGRARAAELLAGDAAAWGGTSAAAALDAFLDLDRRMKAIVTAWQVREVDGAQVANDHADAAYDRGVLDDLAALHADAAGWLAALDGAPRRIAWYGDRLAAAAEQAAAGNGKFVASPRVDSYHGAWFELHEDLIRLAGRTREDEVAAGRA